MFKRKLKREISLLQAVGIFTGVILGSGILILPAIAANVAGASSLISWTLMTLLAVPIALTFGRLASSYPSAGGISEFARQAFGRKKLGKLVIDPEVITGFLFLFVVPVGSPVVLLTGASYLGSLFSFNFIKIFILSLTMLLVILTANLRGIKIMGNFQTMISSSIVILLIFVIVSAFHLVKPENLKIQFHLYPVGRAMALIFWCYVGWEAVTHLSEEFKNPERDFPLSILMTLAVVGILYLLVSFVVVGTHTYGNNLKGITSLVKIAESSLGIAGKVFVSLIGFMTCFGSVNVYVSSSSRLLYALSRRGYLPECFSTLNYKHVPHNALIAIVGAMILVLISMWVLHLSIENLLLLSNSIFIILYLIGSLAGLILLKNKLFPAISFVVCLATFFFVGKCFVYPLLVIVLAVAYFNLRPKGAD